jgi:hypothetical protein
MIPLFEGAAQPLSTLTFSLTGTSTATDTYSDNNRSVPNANPVVADVNGYFGEIFLSRYRYKVIWKNASGTTLKTWDPVDAPEIHIRATALPSDPQAEMIVDNTTDGHRYQRNLTNSAWVDLGLTDSVSGASVTQQLTGTASNVLSTPDSVAALWQRGTDIASASSLSLPSTGGGVFNVTGTTTINGIGAAQGGRALLLIFGGALTLTYNATSMILPGGASLTTEAGDCACFVNEAAADASSSNWRCVWYQRDSNTLAPPVNYAASQAEMEAAASALRWLTPANAKFHPLMPKAWAQFNGSTAGTNAPTEGSGVTSITRSAAGDYTVNLSITMATSTYATFGFCMSVTGGTGGFISRDPADSKTTTSFRIRARRSDTGAAIDATEISIFVFGDT